MSDGRMAGDIEPRKGGSLGQNWPPDSSEGPEIPCESLDGVGRKKEWCLGNKRAGILMRSQFISFIKQPGEIPAFPAFGLGL